MASKLLLPPGKVTPKEEYESLCAWMNSEGIERLILNIDTTDGLAFSGFIYPERNPGFDDLSDENKQRILDLTAILVSQDVTGLLSDEGCDIEVTILTKEVYLRGVDYQEDWDFERDIDLEHLEDAAWDDTIVDEIRRKREEASPAP